ncbi:hypothetical protein HYALB_00008847 [Hymenoscyphus albidus]|uniref:MYND-type domain-containing protein n=1 Tax=Hymenoscyphus albidus TaxID=595503 RepID=A0A9N9Q7N8_9HELO|nr:hypothetical protein HYALB_00008847 [Hymenoscyphus albidus]
MSVSQPPHFGSPEWDPDTHYCALCNKKATARCPDCKTAYYCSTSCQKADFQYHKSCCTLICQFTSAHPRPTHLHHLVIKFPVDQKSPELMWFSDEIIPALQTNDELFPGIPNSSEGIRVLVAQWLRSQNPREEKYMLDHDMALYFRPGFLFDGSDPNQSVKGFFNFEPSHDWRGDLYVSRLIGRDRTTFAECYPQDFQAADLRVLSAFFKSYGRHTSAAEINKSNATYIHSILSLAPAQKHDKQGPLMMHSRTTKAKMVLLEST